MNSLRAVLPHPEQRFKSQRLVFWHDIGGEYTSEVDALDLAGITTLQVRLHPLHRSQRPDRITSTFGSGVPSIKYTAALLGTMLTPKNGKLVANLLPPWRQGRCLTPLR